MFDDPYEQGIALTDEQRLHWLRLIRSEQVGPSTFRDLINHFGTAEQAIDALPDLAKRGGAAKRIRIAELKHIETELEQAARLGIKLIAMGEPDYPSWLRAIDDAPPVILVKGHLSALEKPMIAIVGARNCSIIGRKMTVKLARDLGQAGYCIASGLARGIDGVAHEAALETGTVAVLAGGLDRIYPSEHESLSEQITATGCLLSEKPLGWTARAQDFPRRNRIVSGLSLGTIIVEAARRSGSLITANLALKQNREVFAVPGSPLDPRAAGPNQLIKQGATLVTEAKDVLDALRPLHGTAHPAPPAIGLQESPTEEVRDLSETDRSLIIDALGMAPVETDELIRVTGISGGAVYLVLLELDLAGRLARHPGNKVSLVE
ncbi:DNA-processing protein DprA [Pararhizobium sp. IMCC21322]|uniref:DNA-processing protein DprA n=1 Tax=Pararhizobium sp. IMCC21322 TaxID=3067903 RepID=UPI0035319FF0